MSFDQAQEAFRAHKTCRTAGAYLDAALNSKGDDVIGIDTFFDALGEIADWLNKRQ